MKNLERNTPMHKAWEAYKATDYYAYHARKSGLDIDNPDHEGSMWWIFSKGYEAAINKMDI